MARRNSLESLAALARLERGGGGGGGGGGARARAPGPPVGPDRQRHRRKKKRRALSRAGEVATDRPRRARRASSSSLSALSTTTDGGSPLGASAASLPPAAAAAAAALGVPWRAFADGQHTATQDDDPEADGVTLPWLAGAGAGCQTDALQFLLLQHINLLQRYLLCAARMGRACSGKALLRALRTGQRCAPALLQTVQELAHNAVALNELLCDTGGGAGGAGAGTPARAPLPTALFLLNDAPPEAVLPLCVQVAPFQQPAGCWGGGLAETDAGRGGGGGAVYIGTLWRHIQAARRYIGGKLAGDVGETEVGLRAMVQNAGYLAETLARHTRVPREVALRWWNEHIQLLDVCVHTFALHHHRPGGDPGGEMNDHFRRSCAQWAAHTLRLGACLLAHDASLARGGATADGRQSLLRRHLHSPLVPRLYAAVVADDGRRVCYLLNSLRAQGQLSAEELQQALGVAVERRSTAAVQALCGAGARSSAALLAAAAGGGDAETVAALLRERRPRKSATAPCPLAAEVLAGGAGAGGADNAKIWQLLRSAAEGVPAAPVQRRLPVAEALALHREQLRRRDPPHTRTLCMLGALGCRSISLLEWLLAEMAGLLVAQLHQDGDAAPRTECACGYAELVQARRRRDHLQHDAPLLPPSAADPEAVEPLQGRLWDNSAELALLLLGRAEHAGALHRFHASVRESAEGTQGAALEDACAELAREMAAGGCSVSRGTAETQWRRLAACIQEVGRPAPPGTPPATAERLDARATACALQARQAGVWFAAEDPRLVEAPPLGDSGADETPAQMYI